LNDISYTIRVSPRARHVRLKVTPAEGLCVVVPRNFDQSQLPLLLAGKQAWIRKALLRVGDAPQPLATDFRPSSLDLRAIGEHWQISYRDGGAYIRLEEHEDSQRLIVSVADQDQARILTRLRGWLALRAKSELVEKAHSLASDFGLEIKRVTIRNQRARWGSCSSKNNISLNLKLLFVTPQQLRYVLIHELCHTVHMNHSTDFWALVESFDPGFKQHQQAMRLAWREVPGWV
jgi:predicted metal-dependent hydrolase